VLVIAFVSNKLVQSTELEVVGIGWKSRIAIVVPFPNN